MSESRSTRPSQVTMAGWMAALGSGFLLLTLFDLMSRVRSLEMREAINQFRATPLGEGMGLSVDATTDLLRTMMFVAGAAAAVTLVLAIYVLQRNNTARVGFTIAAVPIVLTAPVSGGFLPIVIAFAATMLWTKPARDWFSSTSSAAPREPRGFETMSSENKPPESEGSGPPSDADAGGQQAPRMPDPDSQADRPMPPPTQGFGAPSYPHQQPQQGQQPQYPQQQPQQGQYPQAAQPPQQGHQWYGQQPVPHGYSAYGPQHGQQGDPGKRPGSVAIAAWLTWVFSGLTVLFFLIVAFSLIAARDVFLEGIQSDPTLQRLDIPTDDIIAGVWVAVAVCTFWSAAAIVLAVLAYRRQNWARITLVVSAAFTGLFSLLAIGSVVSVLTLGAAVATIILLFVGGANQWYSPHAPGYPPGPPGQYGQGYDPNQGLYGPPQGGQYGGPPPGDQEDPPKNVW